MRAFIDSNVAVYWLVDDGSVQHARAQSLMESHGEAGSLVISTQVLLETYNVLAHRKRVSPALVRAAMQLLARYEVIVPSRRCALAATELAAQHGVSIWDAFIVEAALEAGCEVLYSEDLQAGRRFGRLEVVNPFEDAAHEVAPGYAGETAQKPARSRGRPASKKTDIKRVRATGR